MKAVILGSASDVGMAAAQLFAEKGFDLVLASRNPEGAQDLLAKDIQIRHGVKASTILFDAIAYDSHQALVNSLGEVTVVISVFGVLGDHDKAIIDFAEARRIVDSNYLGNVSILGHFANSMEKAKTGTIACISSVAGERGRGSNYFYGSSKAGLSAFLSGLRNRLQPTGVHVLSVQPGFIKTKMIDGIETPGPLTAQPQEVAKTIYKGYEKKKNILFVKPIWRLVMLVIRNIPEALFKKLKL